MKKFDNYVYMFICEITLKLFKDSNCMTYSNYCRLLAASLKDGNLSNKQIKHISIILSGLEKVFYFNSKESAEYLSKFFMLDKFDKFEESVRMTKEFYPNSGDFI